ncbi:MAG: iron ABC transporter permease [Gammaproteobacteria bacterium]|nr:iron ABC transporter permease [Gammaproteobacteria bacterium]MBU1491599.1 iron ABC transporter permease [Gammaproteobacteria bacterium]MBU2066585.1 iron ABC transporter permease [Gammaproteobacteria bacterium]MBU2137701.1 iron ABC transporter permease [Gammaproteobacteria bacterium]MBU2215633.1 iron ABC transporter permease [Gammaproteobacteria bacterium]
MNEQMMPAANSLQRAYRRTLLSRWLCLGVLTALVLASFITDLATGPAGLGWWDVARGLLQPGRLDAAQAVIILELRVPYALMALVVGASLGLAGAEMQTALNNPLASPFTLGVGAAATLGAALVILLRPNLGGLGADLLLPLAAFACAFLSCLLLLLVARLLGEALHTLVLFGIALLFGLNALVGLLQFLADADALQQIVFWTLGSLARADLQRVALVTLVFGLCLVLALRQAWALTSLRGGEEQARSLGIRVGWLRTAVLLRVSLLTGVATAFVGEVGFIGLVGPHVARLLLGEDHRFYLPGSALAGALLLSLASLASRALLPGVILPVGLVTAVVGVPLFIVLILARGRSA